MMPAWFKRKAAIANALREAQVQLRLMGRLLVANDKSRFDAEAKATELHAENSRLRDEVFELNDHARRQAARIEELEQLIADASEPVAITQN